jgi:hypothetical protein
VPESTPRRTLVITLALIVLAVGAAIWGPSWWESRLYRQTEALTGVGSHVLSGSVTDARKKIDPGKTSAEVIAALGHASFAVRSEGSSSHDIWTYYYPDGTMTVNLTDGIVQRIGVTYGPPYIPTSRRR